MSDLDKQLKDMLPRMDGGGTETEYISNGMQIEPIYDVANSKLHYQTKPYLDVDGKIKVKRVATYDVEVQKAFTLVEEYTMTTNYGDTDGK